MPTTPRILGDGQLLVVTHLGQVLIFDAHRGTVEGTPLDLVAGVDPTDSQRGLADCAAGALQLPGRGGLAFAPSTGMVVLGLWEPGADSPVLLGLRYRAGQSPLLTREWTSDAVGGGRWPAASPLMGRRCTSTVAMRSCGRSTPPTANRNGLCPWAI